MKKIKLTIAVLAMATMTFAQQAAKKEQDKEISNAEKFSERSGTLIQKEFVDIGDIKKCKIQISKYTDLISGQKSSAVRFELEYQSSYSSDTKVAILDADEIEGLMKSIKIIQDKVFPTNATNYTEVNFRSRSGFQAGCFSKKDSWSTFMKLEKFDSNSYVFMDKEDLTKLYSLLEQAKAKL